MKNYIIATSGHIDHGKTAFVKALTGIECDSHKQEKERGITINLGFTSMNFENDISVSIIDVPGHKNFVNTMVAGVSCIKLALLVIAADSGVMPQTKEHIKILESLGIRNVFIIVNKVDLVDELILEIFKDELSSFISGTFIEKAPIFCVSSLTYEGIECVKRAIYENLISTESNSIHRSRDGFFRMYTDRAFSLSGKGCVVTGSILDGSLTIADNIYVSKERNEYECKVKELQICGTKTDKAEFNNRVAINLKTSINADFFKGCLISSEPLMQSFIIDAEVLLFSSATKKPSDVDEYNNKTIFIDFLIGTILLKAKMKVLFKIDEQKYLAQICFPFPISVKYADRFIIRTTSSDETVGGGKIIDINPLKHIKRTKELSSSLLKLLSGDIGDIIYNEATKSGGIIDIKELSQKTNFSIKELASNGNSSLLVCIKDTKDNICFATKKIYEEVLLSIPKNIKKKHSTFPLSQEGLNLEEIVQLIDIKRNIASKVFIESVLLELTSRNIISKHLDTWVLYGHNVNVDEKTFKEISYIEKAFKDCALNAPNLLEIEENSIKTLSIDKKKFEQILVHLVSLKRIYRIEDTYIHSDIVDCGREKIIAYLQKNSNGVSVATFRDLINGNRKISLLLLAIYDREKLTIRNGDYRLLYKTI